MHLFKSVFASFVALSLLALGCGPTEKEKMNKELTDFIKAYELKVKPLEKEASTTYFNASITGSDADFKKYEELSIQLTKIFSNREDFAKLKAIKDSKLISDTLLNRQLDVLYNAYLSNQVDTNKLNEEIKIQTVIEQKFNTFRAEVNGKKFTDNEVEEILQKSIKSDELKNTWEASKKSGTNVAEDIIKIVKLRNTIAKELGFNNYHEMSLKLGDQDPKEIEKIFDELDSLTRGSFAKLKAEMDDYFAKRYKIKKEDLKPWHYQNRFFQEAPKIYDLDIDKYYKDKDVVALTKKYYDGIGFNIDDILAKSDLYEKPGKNQHAYCISIDKAGDVRVLCNVKNNMSWMGTMLHEFGHATYDKYIDTALPYTLRDPAHTFTTEAVAMIFGRFASNAQWLKDVVGISEEEKAKIQDNCIKTLRLEQLTFSRWAQVMYRFEKSLYENPDQDLNKLWWDLVEKYQMLKRPENRNQPDWASKIHIATSPCYYHNYLLGELLASQFYYYITTNIVKSDNYKSQSFANNPEVGKFFKEKVFAPGAKFYWNEMIEKATGEKLTAKYYAKQFVD